MIERGTRKSVLVPVLNRSRETLDPIIRKYILPGTHIISDKWTAYSFLANDIEFKYSSINHSSDFVDPADIETQHKILNHAGYMLKKF